MGYSTGAWEGDTLVVTTVGFNGRTWLDDAGHPHTADMRVTGRLRRPDDPQAYATPWTVTQANRLDADGELLEYVCNQNNRDVPHMVGK
jgi:hypothetical protein